MKILFRMRRAVFLLPVVFCLFFFSASEAAEDGVSAGRKIISESQNCVITLEIVISSRMGMAGQESTSEGKTEITATIIDPSGLAVFSLSASNPADIFGRLMKSARGEDSDFKMESEITKITMRLADGKEIPGTIVMRDTDLDMAFVRPEKPLAEPLKAIDLSLNAKAEILEPVIFLSRMGRDGGWVVFAVMDYVRAVMARPRTFYVPDENITALGCPVFNVKGKIVGILLLRMPPVSAGAGNMGFGSLFGGGLSEMGIFPVILPAEDIIGVAKQIPASSVR
ncbi:MAG: trypsin-like peptidase domain-containing protein [Candidatus Omnitrophica bacterium]|nr:trypsin-like peptidase domain-containing protein [Candidatus Omnitrophota bacterium]